MRMEYDHIQASFVKLKEVNKHQNLDCIDTDRIPVSVDDVLTVIGEVTGYTIQPYSVLYEGSHTRGLIEVNHEKKAADIYIRGTQTLYEQRFAVVKEASALLVIHGPEDCSVYGVKTIAAMVEDAYSRENDGEHTDQAKPAQCDVLAEFIAIEIMYPYGCRMKDEQALSKGDVQLPTLAKKYQLPHHIIAKALFEANMKLSSDLWAAVYREHKASSK